MKDFVKISRYAGMRGDLVQGSGGNTSCKLSENRMVIKASGWRLAEVTESVGFSVVNPQVIIELLSRKKIDEIDESEWSNILSDAYIEGERPSIETFIHTLSGKYTLHTHPVVVNAIMCRSDGVSIMKSLFPNAIYIEYGCPGNELAKKYVRAINENIDYDRNIIFLQNHGLIVSGNSAKEVIEVNEYILNKIETYLKCDMSSYHNITALSEHFSNDFVLKISSKNVDSAYLKYRQELNFNFCPDCTLFLGKGIEIIPNELENAIIKEYVQKNGKPTVVDYQNNIFIVAPTLKKAQDIESVLDFSAQVLLLNDNKNINYLTEIQQNELLNMESEKYRKNK